MDNEVSKRGKWKERKLIKETKTRHKEWYVPYGQQITVTVVVTVTVAVAAVTVTAVPGAYFV